MKTIGILSDTHGYLHPRLFEFFKDCDEIWHAGDIGGEDVAQRLAAFKPLKAVYGNIDDAKIRAEYPLDHYFEVEGAWVWMTHIAGSMGKYNARVQQLLRSKKYQPNIFICGHSHILKVAKDPVYGFLHINPGAAGKHGFHKVCTAIRMKIHNNTPQDLEVIHLEERGRIG